MGRSLGATSIICADRIHPCTVHPSPRILIVDDDAGIRSLMASYLERHGLGVDTAGDTTEMRHQLGQQPYALIVLDLMLPGEDGLSALRALQKSGGPPVIMLSAVGTDVDRIVGLEVGAEDYLAKPCNPRELLARIRTVLRRGVATAPQPLAALEPAVPAAPAFPMADDSAERWRFDGWHIDLTARMLHDPGGAAVHLSDSEFRLLRALVQHPRRVLTRDQLLDYARPADHDSYDRAIDVQISRLRRKLSHGEQRAALIRTVRNEGYMFVPVVARA
jgi:two-component system OmpR family response regulator